MNLSTGRRISLLFTLFVVFFWFFFAFLVNWVFYIFWYKKEIERIGKPLPNRIERFQNFYEDNFRRVIILEENTVLWKVIKSKFGDNLDDKIWIFSHNGKRFMVDKDRSWRIILNNITEVVERQFDLIKISLLTIIVVSIVWYFVSWFFVNKSLKDLRTLSKKLEEIDISKLNLDLNIKTLPENDEIQIVADSIMRMNNKINDQVKSIKNFISNVSHEFKTPLMSIKSTIDITSKKKNYDEWLTKISNSIMNLSWMLDVLTYITKFQAWQNLKKDNINLREIIDSEIEIMSQKYLKEFKLNIDVDKSLTIFTNAWWIKLIVKNLIQNSFKYSNDKLIISIKWNWDYLEIKDNWIWICKENIDKIFNPFWQWDSSKKTEWFWLWLALVKQVCDINNWIIQVNSIENIWTEFKIIFNGNIV